MDIIQGIYSIIMDIYQYKYADNMRSLKNYHFLKVAMLFYLINIELISQIYINNTMH